MELHEVEKQLILYTKNHFKRINYDEDLKYFAAELYGLSPEQVEKYSIIHMVNSLYQELVDNRYLSFNLESFLIRTFNRSLYEKGKHEITWDHTLQQMLAEIQGMRIKGWSDKEDLELGEVNLSLLPLQHICPSCKKEVEEHLVPSFLFHGMCMDCQIKLTEEARKNGIIIEY